MAWKHPAGGCDWSLSCVRPDQKGVFCAFFFVFFCFQASFVRRFFGCAESSFGSNKRRGGAEPSGKVLLRMRNLRRPELPSAAARRKARKAAVRAEAARWRVSPARSRFHFPPHSYANAGQGMRGFSRSMRNLAFCVGAAQAAATEARGEIEFSWNSPVSLALGGLLNPTGTAWRGFPYGPSRWRAGGAPGRARPEGRRDSSADIWLLIAFNLDLTQQK